MKYWVYSKPNGNQGGNVYFLKSFNRHTGEKRKVKISREKIILLEDQFTKGMTRLADTLLQTKKNLRNPKHIPFSFKPVNH